MEQEIIYIIGSGRSGTSLLDIVLGNASNAFSLGEVNRFTERDGKPYFPRDENVVRFWKKVNNEMEALHYKHPSYYYKLFSKFEYHSGILRILLPFLQNKKRLNEYAAYQNDLFHAISNTTDSKTYLIDSSKYPVRAYFLSKFLNRKISFIYVKRNPSAVAESFQKKEVEQPAKSRLKAHAYIFFSNIFSQIVLKKLRKNNFQITTIDYETFLQEPVSTIERIQTDLNLNLQDLILKLQGKERLNVGFLFEANRLRLDNSIVIKQDFKKPEKRFLNTVFYPLHNFFWYQNKLL